jgi:hypothetical protein
VRVQQSGAELLNGYKITLDCVLRRIKEAVGDAEHGAQNADSPAEAGTGEGSSRGTERKFKSEGWIAGARTQCSGSFESDVYG